MNGSVRVFPVTHPHLSEGGGESSFSPLQTAQMRMDAEGATAGVYYLYTQNMACEPRCGARCS